LWSAKEAVLKALRHGLRVDTRRVEVVYVAGVEGRGTVVGFPSGASPSVAWPPDETWHDLQIECAAGLASGGPASGRDRPPPDILPVRAWWRPWGEYVITIATYG
jgi:hypothetical protein